MSGIFSLRASTETAYLFDSSVTTPPALISKAAFVYISFAELTDKLCYISLQHPSISFSLSKSTE